MFLRRYIHTNSSIMEKVMRSGRMLRVRQRSVWYPGWSVEYRARASLSHFSSPPPYADLPPISHWFFYSSPRSRFVVRESILFDLALRLDRRPREDRRWIGCIAPCAPSRRYHRLREKSSLRDEHLLPRETGSTIAGRQMAAIEEGNFPKIPISAWILLKADAARGHSVSRFSHASGGLTPPFVRLIVHRCGPAAC